MKQMDLNGANKALLDEYHKAIKELAAVIEPITDTELTTIIDKNTKDLDCISIQSILTHVICSGYGYTIYIENSLGNNKPRLEKVALETTKLYIENLELMYKYCENCFESFSNLNLEELQNDKKILVNWGQLYDIEQLMEHAIVHILRHRRQIEKFIAQL
jgi:uncharacterized damage-inducible protein DinB